MRRTYLVAVLAGVLTMGSTAVAHATSSRGGAPASVRADDVAAAPATTAAQEGPPTVTPRPGMRHVRPIPWRVAEPLDNETVRVVFDSGVEPCHVLDHVTVAYRPDAVIITLYEGSDPRAEGQACILIAVEKATVVTLAEPLRGRTIVDGAPPHWITLS